MRSLDYSSVRNWGLGLVVRLANRRATGDSALLVGVQGLVFRLLSLGRWLLEFRYKMLCWFLLSRVQEQGNIILV